MMSEDISKTGRPAGLWLVVLMAMLTTAEAGSAYLPLTGPTPLRFAVAMVKPAPLLLPSVPAPVEKNGDKTPPVTIVAPPVAANISEEPAPSETQTNPPPSVNVEIPAATSFAAHSAADNLLVITPQMLAEYFKPFPNATNAAGVSVFVPVQVGFTPPLEKNPASSRATFKVQ